MNTQSPYIDPMFGIGDIVTVVGKYAGEWQGQKLLITGVEYFPKQKVVKYQTHPADDPTSEGGTYEWPEDQLSICQYNKWNTRPSASSPDAAELKEALRGFLSDGRLTGPRLEIIFDAARAHLEAFKPDPQCTTCGRIDDPACRTIGCNDDPAEPWPVKPDRAYDEAMAFIPKAASAIRSNINGETARLRDILKSCQPMMQSPSAEHFIINKSELYEAVGIVDRAMKTKNG